MLDVRLSEPPTGWSVDVDDLFGCAQFAIEYMGEDGFLDDWNGGPGWGIDDHGSRYRVVAGLGVGWRGEPSSKCIWGFH